MTTSNTTSEPSFKIFYQEVESKWSFVGVVREGEIFPKIVMPKEIPNSPGIYRIFSPTSRKCYVGESKSLKNRLKKYENAGYVEGAQKIWTDRTVQRWIAESLRSKETEIQVWCCSSANIRNFESDWEPLDLREKYFRSLIEAITIAREPDLAYVNKHYQK